MFTFPGGLFLGLGIWQRFAHLEFFMLWIVTYCHTLFKKLEKSYFFVSTYCEIDLGYIRLMSIHFIHCTHTNSGKVIPSCSILNPSEISRNDRKQNKLFAPFHHDPLDLALLSTSLPLMSNCFIDSDNMSPPVIEDIIELR